MLPLKLSTPAKEGPFRVSKWLKHQVLLDDEEMKQLLLDLPEFKFYMVSEPVSAAEIELTSQQFLESYKRYVQPLKVGQLPEEDLVRRHFSVAASCSSDALYSMEIKSQKDRFLVLPSKPVVQLQLHRFFLSTADGKFYPMVLSADSITWGIQFSYPQLYQDPKTCEITKVAGDPQFSNTSLFQSIVKWLRDHSMPTPFLHESKRVNVPMRIGKRCLEWINRHPGLINRGLSVV
jgi:hypothetical protein